MMGKDYTIGLDIGTNSVGWAVIDDEFEVLRVKKMIKANYNLNEGKIYSKTSKKSGQLKPETHNLKQNTNMWGVRLFEEGHVAADRRIKRTARRRLARRKWRLTQLQKMFYEPLQTVDANFFRRLDESFLQYEDKGVKESYPLFRTEIEEKKYYQQFPTISHLKKRLVDNVICLKDDNGQTVWQKLKDDEKKADLREIYLAIHHIMKYRGHFLFEEFSLESDNFEEVLIDFVDKFNQYFVVQSDNSLVGKPLNLAEDQVIDVVTDKNKSKSVQQYELVDLADMQSDIQKAYKNILAGIVGNKINLKTVFSKTASEKIDWDEIKSESSFQFSKENIEEEIENLREELGDDLIDLVLSAKSLYDAISLKKILDINDKNSKAIFSTSMVERYEKHKLELKELKHVIKREFPNKFEEVFKSDSKINNYKNYVKQWTKIDKRKTKVKEADFYDYIKGILKASKTEAAENIRFKIEQGDYLRKQRTFDNGSIPHQVHEQELKLILKNQAIFYPFLTDVSDNILKMFNFRIPYYVGPLVNNKNKDNSVAAWLVKNEGEEATSITPWNFDTVVNSDESSLAFIERMTGNDTYLTNEKALPKNSLLYQKFTVFNELTKIRYRDNQGKLQYFTRDEKSEIFDKFFKVLTSVSGKNLHDYLASKGIESSYLKGLDKGFKGKFNANFSSYIVLSKILDARVKLDDVMNQDMWEDIVKMMTVFEDKKILKRQIEKKYTNALSPSEIKKLSKKHFTGWGRLSYRLIDGIRDKEFNKTILDFLMTDGSHRNLMQLINDDGLTFKTQIEKDNASQVIELNYDCIASISGSPAIKKGIWQSLKIVKEIEDIMGYSPKNIVIEFARENESTKRTKSAIKALKDNFANFNGKDKEVNKKLIKLDDKVKLSKRERLYFMQNGKDMYTGLPLDFDKLSTYDIDHIYPQSLTKDDSYDNTVLVSSKANRGKSSEVISIEIQNARQGLWESLSKVGLVSPKKLSYLNTKTLTEEIKDGFINRQLVETRQIVKHVASFLNQYYNHDNAENKEKGVNILTPKATLASNFKKMHGFNKVRELNDYHHAHDAYLNAAISLIILQAKPELLKELVYAMHYTRKDNKEKIGIYSKNATQRKKMYDSLLDFTLDAYLTNEDGEILWESNYVIPKMRKIMNYRQINITKKAELLTGKFGDETVYQADEKSKNFASGLKRYLSPQKYGGTKKPISGFAVVILNRNDEIKTVSISSMISEKYLGTEDKLSFIQNIYPNEKIKKILVEKVRKYTRYVLPNGAVRLVSSYKEASNGMQLPMMDIPDKNSKLEDIENTFDKLSKFISDNKLFTEVKIKILNSTIRENFSHFEVNEKIDLIQELLRVTKGQNQNLKVLSKAGLGTTAQQLQSENIITNETTLIHQSVTGLYETRVKLK